MLSSGSYILLLLSLYFLWPLLLAPCPLFLQPPACRACKPRHGLFLPAEASLDVSNPSRFLTPVNFTGEMHMPGWEPEPSTISSSWWLQPGLHNTAELNPSQILDWQDINKLLGVYQNCRGNLKQIVCQQKLTFNVLFQHMQNESEIKVVYVASLQTTPWKFLLPEYFRAGNKNINSVALIVGMLLCSYFEW